MWWYIFGILYLFYAIWIVKFYHNLIYVTCKHTENVPQDLPEKFKPFTRYDRHRWPIYKIYLGAIFILPIRLFFVACVIISTSLIIFALRTNN